MSEAPASRSTSAVFLFNRAPMIASMAAFFAGALSLLDAAVPGKTKAVGLLARGLGEAPVLLAAAAGVALMAVSIGLSRRIRPAWIAALILSLHGFALSTLLKPNLAEALASGALAVFLLASRRAFFRRSALGGLRVTQSWVFIAGGAVLLAALGAALWAGHQKGFIEAKWWDLVIDPALGKAGRPVALAGGLVLLLGFASFVATRAHPSLPVPDQAQLAKISDILHGAEDARPESVLAFTGDKSFTLSPDGGAFVMAAATGGSLISMGGPVGKRAAWRPALQAFKDEAARLALRPAIYAAPPELLPDLIDLDFRIEKIGENAILDLETFSLSGRKREVIRRGRRKLAERQGATFKLCSAPHPRSELDRLKPVSDAWLAQNGGEEKRFSLGRFDRNFLDRCPIGIAEIGGRVAAFGSLWTTPDKGWAGIDLMRFDPDFAPTNTMDFLLVELILWAKTQGYAKFDLAMAPLSGLATEDQAPLFERLGRMIYERGERFYNFRGLRRFKEKFGPSWEPRYLAAPGAWSLPVVLADAAMLTNGSPLDRKPAREPETV